MNKEILLSLIQTKLNENTCGVILNRVFGIAYNREQGQFLANSSDWREDLHPRDGDGQFAPKGKIDLIGKGGETPTEMAQRFWREAEKAYRDYQKGRLTQDKKSQELAAKADEAKERYLKIKEITPEMDRREAATKMAKEFYQAQDDMDAIEEKYGDNALGGPLKFTGDETGKADRKRYRELRRRCKLLEKKIDWDLVDEDDAKPNQES